MILKALVLGSERLDGKGGIANWRLWQGGCGLVWVLLLFCTVVCTVLCATIMVWGGIDDEQRGRCPLECSGQYGICAFLDITTPFCVLIANILQNYLVIATITSARVISTTGH